MNAKCPNSDLTRLFDYDFCCRLKSRDCQETRRKKEEKQKFVFKYVMKGLKDRIKRSYFTRKKVLKSLLESRFFDCYFAEATADLKDTIGQIHRSGTGPNDYNFVCKRMNKRYLQNMFEVEKFRSDFFCFLSTEFLPLYGEKVEKKITAFLDQKVGSVVDNKGLDEDGVRQVCEEIRGNSKWKIPWTFREAKNAVEEFQKEFERPYLSTN